MIEIKDVENDYSLNKLSLKYTPRRVKVVSGRTFETPTRSITDRDYENNKNSPSKVQMQDFVSNLTVYQGGPELKSLLSQNGKLKNLNDKIQNFLRPAINSPVRLLSLRLEPEETFSLLSTQSQVERFLKFLSLVQRPMGTMSLPFFKTTGVNWRNLYNEFTKSYDNAVVWLRMDEEQNAFEKRIDYLVELVKNKRLQMLGIHYADVLTYNVNFDYFYEKLHDKEVLTVLEGVPRIDDKIMSGVHIYPFASFDVITPFKKNGRGGGDDTKPSGKFFSKTDASLRKINEVDYESVFGQYRKTPIWEILEFVKSFKGKVNKDDLVTRRLFRQFGAFSYAQQAKDGEEEMINISQFLSHDEGFDYLDEKNFLKSSVRRRFLF